MGFVTLSLGEERLKETVGRGEVEKYVDDNPLRGSALAEGLSEEQLYYQPSFPREMLEGAKANRGVKAGPARRGVGAEARTAGMAADKQPHTGEHTQARTGHQAPGKTRGVFPQYLPVGSCRSTS